MQQQPPPATATTAATAPQEVNMEEAWAAFRAGVTSVFKQWMVLHLAVANNWGGGDSYRKATLLLEDVLKMYQPNPRAGLRPRRAPDQYDVEDKLAAYLDEQFETLVEDGSIEEVSELVAAMWTQCARGDYSLARETVAREEQVLRLQHRFSEVSRSASQQAADQAPDDEMDDSESEDEDDGGQQHGGGAMRAAAAAIGGGGEMEMEVQGEGGMAHDDEGEEEPPAVDEDGWTTVRTARRRNPRRSSGGSQQQPRVPSLFG